MNKFNEARIRSIYDARRRYTEASSCEDYKTLVAMTPSLEHRGEEDFVSALEVCKQCCPDGYCKMCGCNYRMKLAIASFECKLGKF